MTPKLLEHLEYPISPNQLLDPSIRKAPLKVNRWAMYSAWCFDWLMAIGFAYLCVNSWFSFIGPLGFDSLPSQTKELITNYSKGVTLLLSPLIFFTINFLGIHFHSMTPGQKIFKHSVSTTSATQSAQWAFGATVSAVSFGLPLFNDLIDQLAQSETTSWKYQYWKFALDKHQSYEVEVVELEVHQDEAQDYKQAA
ncbi:MAG: hypothetical protein K2P81_14295 [Bacteriovoracaceae bacterium]|nr:hypothetical protein [Bacteriovoracaceae bacterium]